MQNRIQNMTHMKLLLTIALATTVAFCRAQQPAQDTTKKITHTYSLPFYNHQPGLLFHKPSLHYGVGSVSDCSCGKRNLKTGSSYMRLDYSPLMTRDNYSLLSRPDFIYRYDPLNPYGVRDPLDGVVNGGLDYLLGKIFQD